jgi:hypothetical protein
VAEDGVVLEVGLLGDQPFGLILEGRQNVNKRYLFGYDHIAHTILNPLSIFLLFLHALLLSFPLFLFKYDLADDIFLM